MDVTRRDLCRVGSGLVALAALGPIAVRATADPLQQAIMAFTDGTAPVAGGVELNVPEIAENGNSVAMRVSAAGSTAIAIFAPANPTTRIAAFQFGALSGASAVSTRIRLAQSQDVVAVAKMPDGSFRMASCSVRVTIGGCGS